MQTFLPYPSFIETAECLDYRRLGKQRVEAKQIIDILFKKKFSKSKIYWEHHPAVLMWEGYEDALRQYFNIISDEWEHRGYKHNMGYYGVKMDAIIRPAWYGLDVFHASHRSNLLRKNPSHYGKFGWKEPNDLPYVWPVRKKYAS